MTKVILNGCSGFMGKVLTDVIAEDPAVEAVAGIDVVDRGDRPYPVFMSPSDCNVEADVIIDFSNYKAVDGILEFAKDRKMPLVLCTTGLTEEQLQKMHDYSKEVAILRSANMSLGINLLMKLVQEAARVLADAGFDMEIVEQHHNRKLDAPSGTALALADSINEAMDQAYTYVFDRSQRHEKRDAKEIGISAVRGGSIVGVHDVIYAGTDEVIELRHTAYSRAIFAKGAVSAAKYLAGKPAGMYDMADVIG
ncbi:MAG: 4-hydroxy-tetrahydrodipicolinate reductase [Eubacterium sp.]|nr:4-hydroxy-tetrahydrodipicolinate reductase [Eubacterium sp.]MBQ9322497.1 4-hydroxy-tetrahydrodipicolinate reductase [Eubacterium sp.]